MGLHLEDFKIMGVLNVTPDSFSDGGRYTAVDLAADHALAMVQSGAALIDIGGESTRPGAAEVSAQEEIERVVPVIEAVRERTDVQISVDTSKLEVARQAVTAGASYVNDVTAFRQSPELAELVAEKNLECCLMHMQGSPQSMQDSPQYSDVVDTVKAFLTERLEFVVSKGVSEHSVMLDPGIGFGKTLEHNLELLNRLGELAQIGPQLVIGTSRKSFIGKVTGRETSERLAGTLASNVLAYLNGASVFRVHDVGEHYDALKLTAATVREYGT